MYCNLVSSVWDNQIKCSKMPETCSLVVSYSTLCYKKPIFPQNSPRLYKEAYLQIRDLTSSTVYLRNVGVVWFLSLDWTHVFDWYVVQWGSKSKHHEDTHLNEIGLCLQILLTTLHSIVNTIGRTYVVNEEINKYVFWTIINKSGDVQFSILFL